MNATRTTTRRIRLVRRLTARSPRACRQYPCRPAAGRGGRARVTDGPPGRCQGGEAVRRTARARTPRLPGPLPARRRRDLPGRRAAPGGGRPARPGRVGGRTLRRARRAGLPAAVPERHVHHARREHADGPPHRPPRAGDAPQRRREADRPDRVEPQRRVQPRHADAHVRPRPRPDPDVRPRPHPGDRRRDLGGPVGGAGRRTGRAGRGPGPEHGPPGPDRAARRGHRGAPPLLGRARRERRHPRAGCRPDADHPAAGEPHRGTPLHRRPARPPGRRLAGRSRRHRPSPS